MARAPHGNNQPPKVIVKKIYIEGGGGHHGGAWKVAYADFVTAMMAFFLLLWILGATTEKQRKGIADYFAPTLLDTKVVGTGNTGVLGGESARSENKNGPDVSRSQKASFAMANQGVDMDPGAGAKGKALTEEDKRNFERVRRQVLEQMMRAKLQRLAKHVRFVQTREGMRIDLVDDADYSMFASGTTALVPQASELIGMIASSIATTSNQLMIRGHTDAVPYGDPRAMNNWMLSSGRAEATRRRLAAGGVPERRVDRIEGVADREPMYPKDVFDPRNRRVAITLLYRRFAS